MPDSPGFFLYINPRAAHIGRLGMSCLLFGSALNAEGRLFFFLVLALGLLDDLLSFAAGNILVADELLGEVAAGLGH